MLKLADLRSQEGDLLAATDLKERAAKLVEPADERAILLDVARACAGPLADIERAARIYEILRVREPADREVWEPLAKVYREASDNERLGVLLEQTAPLVDALEERVALRFERAMLAMKSEPERAMTLFREIVEEDPSQVESAMKLSSMLEERGELGELAALLGRQLDHAKDREDKASVKSLSMRLGALLEQQGDEQAALDVYHAALDWDAQSRDALRAIVRLSLKRDDSLDLGDALSQLLAVEEGQEAVDLALQLAELRRSHDDEAGAEQALAAGYRACPTSTLLRDELIKRYTARAAWHELAGVHLLDASVRQLADERVECLYQGASILWENAGDPAAAADVLRTALAIAPTDHGLLGALIVAYDADNEHPRAIEALTLAIDVAPDDAWLYRSRAAVHRAMEALEPSLADLEVAHTKSGGAYTEDLVAEIESLLAEGRSIGRTERDLKLELAEVLIHAGDAERARGHLTDLVKKDGKDRAALRVLAELEEAAQRWDAASVALRRLLALEDGDALVQTALKLAEACERAERLADARGGLERALRVAPQNEVIRELLRKVYTETGASRELAQMVLEDARAEADVAGRFQHLLYAGRLLFENAEDAPHAIAVLEEARGLRPEEQEAALLLAEAYAVAGRRPDAFAILEQAVAAHKGRRSKQLSLVYQCMASIEEAAGDAPGALAALQKAFESDPHNGALALRVGLIAAELGDRDVVARVFRSLTLMKPAPAGSPEGATAAAKAVAYYHLGLLAEEQGDRRKARLMVEKAVSEDPSYDPARELLEEFRSA
jgi:tetratricopeptide (TPR) repeat protein